MTITLFNEAELADALTHTIEPFWKTRVRTGVFKGCKDVRVSYAWCVPDNPKGSVLISSGRIESLLKYKEVIYDCFRHQLAVFILDHRGQGLSGRMTDNPHHGYVESFSDYVADLMTFYHDIVKPHQKGPLSLLCHSMGSAIGALAALESPALFSKVVFCSPMFGIRPSLPDPVAKLLLWMGKRKAAKAGRVADYFFGQGDYKPVTFGLNKLTHSEVRYQIFRQLYEASPAIQLGGVTTHWLEAARIAMADIEQRAAQLTMPVRLYSAGDDKVVDNRAQQRVAGQIPQCTMMIIDGASHELLIEKDAYRQPVMQDILTFLLAD